MVKGKGQLRRRALGLLAHGALVAGALAIAYLSLRPPPAEPGPLGADKAQHLIAYFALSLLAMIAWGRSAWVRVLICAVAFGMAMEAGQALMPFGREASFLDMVANTLGAATGCALALAWPQRRG